MDIVFPPIDTDVSERLERLIAAYPIHVTDDSLGQLREMTSGTGSDPTATPPDLSVGGAVESRDVVVPGEDGSPGVLMSVFTPSRTTEPLPVIFHTHGGGMVMGSRWTGVEAFLPYVAEGLAAVVTPEYRLAPEAPHPAPVEDCFAGLVWTAQHAEEFMGDPDRIMIVGASAGGGLAAATALMARDRGFPQLTHQVLVCPMLDDRTDTVSSRMLDREGMWDMHDNLYGWTALLGTDRGGPSVPSYAAPSRELDLSNLPRTYIDVGSSETFRDPALDYARRLSEAGVVVDLHMWGGGTHGFDIWAADTALGSASNAVRDEFMRRALRPDSRRERMHSLSLADPLGRCDG